MYVSNLDKLIAKKLKRIQKKLSTESGTIFAKYKKCQTKKHKTLINILSLQINNIKLNKRIFFLVPAFYEDNNIVHTLKSLIPRSPQLLKYWDDNVIIIILNNYLKTKPTPSTGIIVKNFINKCKFKDIIVINYSFNKNQLNVGYCRKLLHDLIIFNANKFTNNLSSCIFASSDADILENDLRIVRKTYSFLQKNLGIDAVQGAMTRIPRTINKNNLFCIYSLIYDAIRNKWEALKYRNKNSTPKINFMWNRIFTYGANLFIKSHSYCKVGGFDSMNIGEDYALGAKISLLYSTPGDEFNTAITNTVKKINYKIVNHPRRDILSFCNQFSPTYKKFGNYSFERKVHQTGTEWEKHYKAIEKEMAITKKNVRTILNILLNKSKKRGFSNVESILILQKAIKKVIKQENNKFNKNTIRIITSQLNRLG